VISILIDRRLVRASGRQAFDPEDDAASEMISLSLEITTDSQE